MHWCICLAALFGTAIACAPSGPQAPKYDCPARRNTARAYFSPQFRTPPALPPGFVITPAEECSKGQCGDNKVFYNARPTRGEEIVSGLTFAIVCPDLCACADDGTCYTWKPDNIDNQVGLALVNDCDGSSFSGCALYALITNIKRPTDGLIATDGSGATIQADDQFDFNTGQPYDIRTNPERFKQIVSATCDGCAGECAQKHPTDY